MKKVLISLLFFASAYAQVSPPSTQSRVAGRFVAYNYGQWSLPIYSFPSGTGSRTFTLNSATVTMADQRRFMPFNTNAPIKVGTEIVTPTTIGSGCILGASGPGICSVTATFTQQHSNADQVQSATFGLQEALNDAGASGGGAIVIDSAWVNLGGTTAIKNAAILPSNTGIEDVRAGVPSGGGSGTVTSVVDASGLFSVANPTTVPTFTYNPVPANTLLAGPTSGGNAAPFFRTLGVSDLPSTTLSAAGSPTTNTLTKWTTSNTISNSALSDVSGFISSTEPIRFNGTGPQIRPGTTNASNPYGAYTNDIWNGTNPSGWNVTGYDDGAGNAFLTTWINNNLVCQQFGTRTDCTTQPFNFANFLGYGFSDSGGGSFILTPHTRTFTQIAPTSGNTYSFTLPDFAGAVNFPAVTSGTLATVAGTDPAGSAAAVQVASVQKTGDTMSGPLSVPLISQYSSVHFFGDSIVGGGYGWGYRCYSASDTPTQQTVAGNQFCWTVRTSNTLGFTNLIGSLALQGNWSNSTAYTTGQTVWYGGQIWVALQNSTGVTPVVGGFWSLSPAVDHGISGTRATEQAIYEYPLQVPATGSPLYFYATGTNDAASYSGVGLQQNDAAMQSAALAFLAVPENQKHRGSAMSQTSGTWVASTDYLSSGSIQSTTNASVLTDTFSCGNYGFAYTVRDPTGGLVGDVATFTYAVDGGTPISLNAYTSAYPIFNNNTGLSTTQGSFFVAISGLSLTSHSIVFTVTSPTSSVNVVQIDWGAPLGCGATLDGPTVLVLGTPRNNSGADATTQEFTTQTKAIVNSLSSLGLNIAYVHDPNYINNLAPSNANSDIYTDNVHPFDDSTCNAAANTGHCGHTHRFQAVLRALAQQNTAQVKQGGISANGSVQYFPTGVSFASQSNSNTAGGDFALNVINRRITGGSVTTSSLNFQTGSSAAPTHEHIGSYFRDTLTGNSAGSESDSFDAYSIASGTYNHWLHYDATLGLTVPTGVINGPGSALNTQIGNGDGNFRISINTGGTKYLTFTANNAATQNVAVNIPAGVSTAAVVSGQSGVGTTGNATTGVLSYIDVNGLQHWVQTVGGGAAINTGPAVTTTGAVPFFGNTTGQLGSSAVNINNVQSTCTNATFSSSTTATTTCPLTLTTSSRCQATWIGSSVLGGVLAVAVTTGGASGTNVVTVTATTANSAVASVSCSVN